MQLTNIFHTNILTFDASHRDHGVTLHFEISGAPDILGPVTPEELDSFVTPLANVFQRQPAPCLLRKPNAINFVRFLMNITSRIVVGPIRDIAVTTQPSEAWGPRLTLRLSDGTDRTFIISGGPSAPPTWEEFTQGYPDVPKEVFDTAQAELIAALGETKNALNIVRRRVTGGGHGGGTLVIG